ncbi:hypothetical protein B0H63DRAFT_137410 [Podospora didyma]|uniref:Uncharacterized protein n=1 Tax=Podospora didyma TaxID=330526 RepID=A0AAE0NRV5_9PEZI|nr:hypothetical protein B0H63DRAFT_137410 [Podospora didyma]
MCHHQRLIASEAPAFHFPQIFLWFLQRRSISPFPPPWLAASHRVSEAPRRRKSWRKGNGPNPPRCGRGDFPSGETLTTTLLGPKDFWLFFLLWAPWLQVVRARVLSIVVGWYDRGHNASCSSFAYCFWKLEQASNVPGHRKSMRTYPSLNSPNSFPADNPLLVLICFYPEL